MHCEQFTHKLHKHLFWSRSPEELGGGRALSSHYKLQHTSQVPGTHKEMLTGGRERKMLIWIMADFALLTLIAMRDMRWNHLSVSTWQDVGLEMVNKRQTWERHWTPSCSWGLPGLVSGSLISCYLHRMCVCMFCLRMKRKLSSLQHSYWQEVVTSRHYMYLSCEAIWDSD